MGTWAGTALPGVREQSLAVSTGLVGIWQSYHHSRRHGSVLTITRRAELSGGKRGVQRRGSGLAGQAKHSPSETTAKTRWADDRAPHGVAIQMDGTLSAAGTPNRAHGKRLVSARSRRRRYVPRQRCRFLRRGLLHPCASSSDGRAGDPGSPRSGDPGASACGRPPAAAVPGRAARPRTGHGPGAWRRCCAGAC